MEYFQYGAAETEYLKKKDKKLGEAIDRIGPIERPVMPDLFAALINSVAGQQISNKALSTVWGRMQQLLCVITPQAVAAQPLTDLQKCGITMKKAVYIKSIAEAAQSGLLDLASLKHLPDAEVISVLTGLNGVGVWTAEMLLIFSLQRPDVLSWGDLGIRRGILMLYHHKELSKERFEQYKKRYSPYGTVASLYIWEIAAGR
jgi:DNA-3-methyladenine glycosylase II